MVAVTSAEPKILKLFIEWLKKFYNANIYKLKARIHLWPDSDKIKCKDFWSCELGISEAQFTKSYVKNKSGKNKKYPFGVCRVGLYNKKMFQTIMKEIDKILAE